MIKSADNTLFQTKTTTKHKRVNMDKNARVYALAFCRYYNHIGAHAKRVRR